MKFVFLMDPMEIIKIEKDTSFALMTAAHARGHEILYLQNGGITLKDGTVFFHVTPVVPQHDKKNPFVVRTPIEISHNDIDVVFIRTDPPFDEQYLMNTWLLERLPANIPVINRPSGIRNVNEKIWATQFTSLVPKTIVGRNKNDVLGFLREEKDIIVKPTNGFGGMSVFRVRHDDVNAQVIFETVTNDYTRDIIVQKYIPAALNGDKRILLLDGKPLGAVLRLHAEHDHRNNFFSGGTPRACDITQRDTEIIEALASPLRKLGLYFVGIDIIGEYLIEVNVTSPTCLVEMNALYNTTLQEKIIDFTENLIKTTCKGA